MKNPNTASITYLDYNSTTPMDDRIIKELNPLFSTWFGNPSSEHHGYGRDAEARVEHARAQVAELAGMHPPDVIFTSGATEANNLALRGIAEGACRRVSVLVGATEHKSVLEAADRLGELGLATVSRVPVKQDGTISADTLKGAISDNGADIVSIMAANSETGVIHPTAELAEVTHTAGALFHCDATQALGRVPFDATSLRVDMVSMSGHKMYGPKGTGALVASRDTRRRLKAIICGGGQEGGLRSGTLNVAGIVGLGRACEIASGEGIADGSRQAALRDRLESRLASRLAGVSVNGRGAPRLPNTSSVRFEGASAYETIANAPALAVSSGSACSASTIGPSHVLVAMGMSHDAADESVRFSIGRPTTEGDIDIATDCIVAAVSRVRDLTMAHTAKNVRTGDMMATTGHGHSHASTGGIAHAS